EVMGRPTDPTKIFYVACDRPIEYAREVWHDLGLNPDKIPMYSFMDHKVPWTFAQLISQIPKGTQLVFAEAFSALIPDPAPKQSLYKAALDFMREVHLYTKSTGTDFFCSTHPPKMKAGESLTSGRNSGIGSVGLPAASGTIIEIAELSL